MIDFLADIELRFKRLPIIGKLFVVVASSIIMGAVVGLVSVAPRPQPQVTTPAAIVVLDERAQKDIIAREHTYQEVMDAAQDARRFVADSRREHCLPMTSLSDIAFCKSFDDIEAEIQSKLNAARIMHH